MKAFELKAGAGHVSCPKAIRTENRQDRKRVRTMRRPSRDKSGMVRAKIGDPDRTKNTCSLAMGEPDPRPVWKRQKGGAKKKGDTR